MREVLLGFLLGSVFLLWVVVTILAHENELNRERLATLEAEVFSGS